MKEKVIECMQFLHKESSFTLITSQNFFCFLELMSNVHGKQLWSYQKGQLLLAKVDALFLSKITTGRIPDLNADFSPLINWSRIQTVISFSLTYCSTGKYPLPFMVPDFTHIMHDI